MESVWGDHHYVLTPSLLHLRFAYDRPGGSQRMSAAHGGARRQRKGGCLLFFSSFLSSFLISFFLAAYFIKSN